MPCARIIESPAGRYSAALLATGIALLARFFLNPVLGDYLPYVTLFPAVVFSALFCGIGPSVVAMIVAVLGTRYWFFHPVHSFSVPHAAQLSGILVFSVVSSILIVFGEIGRRTVVSLRRIQAELEVRAREHTLQLDTAHQHVRDLTGQVLHLQDQERRRIARELHDSVGQCLAALRMNLSGVETEVTSEMERLTKTAAALADSAALVDEMTTEIRTISYLLHPPMLDEAGLASALRWYIQGFSERSKISVHLDVSKDFERLPTDLETAIFRVIQECLTNIHRHSESPVANIRITRTDGSVQIEVQDQGKGIPLEQLSGIAYSATAGVGIGGMRERIRQLGGTLELKSGAEHKGTTVLAQLPVASSPLEVAAAASRASFSHLPLPISLTEGQG
jgi:signal transduction histidine kinase